MFKYKAQSPPFVVLSLVPVSASPSIAAEVGKILSAVDVEQGLSSTLDVTMPRPKFNEVFPPAQSEPTSPVGSRQLPIPKELHGVVTSISMTDPVPF